MAKKLRKPIITSNLSYILKNDKRLIYPLA